MWRRPAGSHAHAPGLSHIPDRTRHEMLDSGRIVVAEIRPIVENWWRSLVVLNGRDLASMAQTRRMSMRTGWAPPHKRRGHLRKLRRALVLRLCMPESVAA